MSEIAYEQNLHDHWKRVIDNGYVNIPSKDYVSYLLSHIEICHAELERVKAENEKYHAALKEIMDISITGYFYGHFTDAVKIAEKALLPAAPEEGE